MSSGWIGVDLDGTLAEYDGWHGPEHIGKPISRMVERVKGWLAAGQEVRIFTARVYGEMAPDPKRASEVATCRTAIRLWCIHHLGQQIAITCVKDYAMIELWDDRAIQVILNTGLRADGMDAREKVGLETGWLIERHTNGFVEWLAPKPDELGFYWTTDSTLAIRFSRHQDGQVFQNSVVIPSTPPAIVTEHQWG